MKKLLIILLVLICCVKGYSQTYNPILHTVTNKALGLAQSTPTDARSMFFDQVNFVYRPYQSITEVKSYLNLSKYRTGNFLIVVDSGGTLNSNGTYTGGVNNLWMFKDGTADGNLIELNFGGSIGTGITTLTATSVSGQTFTITNPTGPTANIALSLTGSGDLTGTWPNITVSKFNNLPPAYYLNYLNLTNTPTIPAQFNPIAGSNITLSGTYPNITFNSTGTGFNTAGVYLVASGGGSVINYDTANFPIISNISMLNDSVMLITYNNRVPDTLSIKGAGGGGGGGGGVSNFSFTNANGVTGVVTNPGTTPNLTISLGAITPTTVNGLTLAIISNGFTITGGTGTPRTLTVNAGNANVSGTNTGDVSLSGETYLTMVGQAITENPINVSGTNITGVLKAAAFPALTGDVTTSAGSLATTIANGAVTYAKIQNVTSQTILGRYALTNGVVQEITLGSGLTLNSSTGVLNTTGVGSVTSVAVASTDLSVSGSPITSSGTITLNVNNNAITYAKFQQVAASSLVGNPTVSLANAQAIGIGYGLRFSGTTLLLDTANIKDTIFVKPVGASGLTTVYISTVIPDTIYNKRLIAGANVTLTQNADSSITIAASGGGAGGITTVGAFDSQTPSTDGAVISGASIFFQSASSTKPGMLNTVAQTIAGAKTFSSAPFFSTLTTPGGIFYGGTAGVLQQTAAGTTTTVLHGGVSPTYGSIVLTTDVSGILPIANGGNATATPSITGGAGISITGSWGAYTITATTLGTVTSISGSGGTTGLTLTGGPITSSGTLTLGGTLVPANGGTGLSSLTPYAVIAGGSTSTGTFQQVSGTGVVGQVLTSNGPGFLPSWQNSSAGFTNPMTTVGDIIIGSTGGAAIRLGIGLTNMFLGVSSGVPTWIVPPGYLNRQDITSGTSGTVINPNTIITFDPPSVLATYNLTLPASPLDKDVIKIYFGGHISSGVVITSFTVSPNSGQTILDPNPPTQALVTNYLEYRYDSSNTTWYVFKN